MTDIILYKSFCWSFGTTSFRTKNFNKTIEQQLDLLDRFWSLDENREATWQGNKILQENYYNFIHLNDFVEGNAPNRSKDAREKTSGLVDIGLIDNGRKLTEAGRALLSIARSGDFTPDNGFQINKDSYIYLKQLLKTYYTIEGKTVRPFIVLLYLLSRFGYLSAEEFKFLMPLCIDRESTEEIAEGIQRVRNGEATVDDIIVARLMGMDNYDIARRIFLSRRSVDETLICFIGINRKSRDLNNPDAKMYDKPYFKLYLKLRDAYLYHLSYAFSEVYQAAREVNIGRYWTRYIFNTTSLQKIRNNPAECINPTVFDGVTTEIEFREVFFRTMHLFKAKATLSDYYDLNRRYIKTTDTVLFEDGSVKMDIVPRAFFAPIIDELFEQAFSASELLSENCDMEDISPCLVFDERTVIAGINAELDINVTTIEDARTAIEDERYRRLQHLIDTKFTDDKLLILLEAFKSRNDTLIRSMVTDNAEVYTIFEYVLGILWYKASGRQGKILDFMKLRHDADLLPVTHAAGGDADIVYEYSQAEEYPAHCLLLEATLVDTGNQRNMELEPVSRHLGQHLLRTGNLNSYCVFAANNLHINVISDFRYRKTMPYYDNNNYDNRIDGMKIIPLEIDELKKIVANGLTYKQLYGIFETAFRSEIPPHLWYGEMVRDKI